MAFLMKKGTTKLFMTLHKLVTSLQELATTGDLKAKEPLLDIMNMLLPEEIEKDIVHLTLKGEKWLCIMLRKRPEKPKEELESSP